MSQLSMLLSDTLGRPGNWWFRLRQVRKKNDGNVIIEFAFVAPILVVLIINILDFSSLIWDQMEVDYSAQMGAQAAYKTCSCSKCTPAKNSTNCPNLNTKVTTAIQSTSLGTGVTLATSSPSEIYYCVSGTTLQSVATYPSSPPADCSAYGSASVPGDYIEVDVTYSYSPTFAGLSLASAHSLTGKSVERLK
jgi:Flp pilus assembly protein TadG